MPEPTPPVTPPATPPATPPKETPPAKPPTTPPSGDFKIPDEHKDKGWAGKVKSQEDLFTQLNTMEGLIGKKSLPFDYSKATENEITAHLKATRPEKIDDYAWGEEGKVTKEDKEFFGGILQEMGIEPYKGNKLIEKYLGKQSEIKEKMFSKDGFMEILKDSFSADGDFKKTTGEVSNIIKANLSETDAKLLDSMPNQFLGLLYRFTNSIKKEYGVNLDTDRGGAGGHGKTDVKALRTEIRAKIMALSKKPHTADEKSTLQKQLDETYK